jgi:tetratricopeptide (TPR) repeat protein
MYQFLGGAMGQPEVGEVFNKGLLALDNGHIYLALSCFEQATYLAKTPLYCSYLALCLAKVRGHYAEAIMLCSEALRDDPDSAAVYLNFGRVYIMAGERRKAQDILRRGLRCEDSAAILKELDLLGERKHPPFPSLRRGHPLNKIIGKLLRKLGVR